MFRPLPAELGHVLLKLAKETIGLGTPEVETAFDVDIRVVGGCKAALDLTRQATS